MLDRINVPASFLCQEAAAAGQELPPRTRGSAILAGRGGAPSLGTCPYPAHFKALSRFGTAGPELALMLSSPFNRWAAAYCKE